MMIYGRRFNKKADSHLAKPDRVPFRLKLTHRRFQWKYTLTFMAILIGAVLLFAGPSWYFISQNYEIFVKLAYDSNPQLVQYLEREILWLGAFLVISGSVTISAAALIGMKMTGNLVHPLIEMEDHMKQLSVGDWSTLDFSHTDHEDFYELLDTYSYLYRSLRAHTEQEIAMLEKLSIDPQNGEAMAIWKSLIQSKKSQLNLSIPNKPNLSLVTATAEESSATDSGRRAS